MKRAHGRKRTQSTKSATNVLLPKALVEEAKGLGVNLSLTFEKHLESVVKEHQAKRWPKENAQEIETYGRFVERHGVFNEDERDW